MGCSPTRFRLTMVTIPASAHTNPARIWIPNMGKKVDDLKSIPAQSNSDSVYDMVFRVRSSPAIEAQPVYDLSGEGRFSSAGA